MAPAAVIQPAIPDIGYITGAKGHHDVPPPTQDRPLSIREYARIQQFPDDWKLMGTSAAKYRQIGNAVSVGLALALGGEVVLSVADQPAEIRTKRFRGTAIHQKLKQAIEIGGNCYAHK